MESFQGSTAVEGMQVLLNPVNDLLITTCLNAVGYLLSNIRENAAEFFVNGQHFIVNRCKGKGSFLIQTNDGGEHGRYNLNMPIFYFLMNKDYHKYKNVSNFFLNHCSACVLDTVAENGWMNH